MPFGAKINQDVFQLQMDAILEQCPGVIGIHDDMVIFGVDQEDHDANLINLLNVCQKEVLNIGYVLNETKEDVRMYIEEFILVDILIHYCTRMKI